MAVAGSLTYDTTIDKNGFENGLNSMTASAVASGNLITEAFSKIAGVIKDAIVSGVEYNAKIEQYNVGLTTLLGSSQKASDVMNQIQKDAQTTPFNVDNLTQAERLLISTGISADDSRKTVLALGDAVSATGGGNDELGRMAVNLQQIKNVGQASALDIKQFAYAGIDVYGLIADYTGKSREEVSKMTIDYDTLSGALQKASSEGGKYYDAMNAQSKTFNGQMSNLQDGLSKLFGDSVRPLSDLLKNTILPAINSFIGSGPVAKGIILSLATAFGILAGALAIQATIGLVQKAFAALNLTLLGNPILLIVALIAGLVAGFIYLWNNCEAFRNFWIGLWNGIQTVFETVWNAISGFFTDTIPNTFKNVTTFIGDVINSVINWFKELPGNIWNALVDAYNKVVDWISNIKNEMSDGIHNIIGSVIELFRELPNKLVDVGRNIVEGLWNGINNATEWILNKIKGFKDAVLDGIKSFFGINSPSTLMRDEVGKYIPEGIAVGIDANTDSALDSIDDMNDAIISKMTQAVNSETGSINATASVKSNNSMLNVIQASFAVDGSVNIDGQKAGRILTPYMSRTLRTAGA